MNYKRYFQGGKMKYGNTKYQIDGMIFDSKKEANRWYELAMLSRAKEITQLQRQKPFELIPTRYYDGVCVRGCKYVADFYYYDVQKKCHVAWETKGYETPDYKIKKKIFLEKYVRSGEIVFIEEKEKIKTYCVDKKNNLK